MRNLSAQLERRAEARCSGGTSKRVEANGKAGAIDASSSGESREQQMDLEPQRTSQLAASLSSERHVSRPPGVVRLPLSVKLLVRVYRPVVRHAARTALEGRRIDPARPEAGRFLRADVDTFLTDVHRRMLDLLREDDLSRIPTLGNRHNVFLAALTIAAYHALLAVGLEQRYAMDLCADLGWKIYERMLGLPFFFARLRSRDPQDRMDSVLKAFMRFPFSSPGKPGYEVRAWSEPGRFYTHWTHCAPLGFVKRYVERHGDRGEIEAFYHSWCLYDWPAADVLAGGAAGQHGHYRRLHTLSRGDSICDMCWSAAAFRP